MKHSDCVCSGNHVLKRDLNGPNLGVCLFSLPDCFHECLCGIINRDTDAPLVILDLVNGYEQWMALILTGFRKNKGHQCHYKKSPHFWEFRQRCIFDDGFEEYVPQEFAIFISYKQIKTWQRTHSRSTTKPVP